jgi:uncharacterized protein
MRRIPIAYILFLVLVLTSWIYYISTLSDLSFLGKNWGAALTMVFGSFIAGSSPEGSAAISYPVFTLLLDIKPAIARNFSFAIQSIGMTSATLMILGLRTKVEWNYILFVTIGGIFGLFFGAYYVVPLISPPMAKLFFVSLWLSFGIALWRENQRPQRVVYDAIQNFQRNDQFRLIVFGFIGGIISSIFGTGINIFTFCLMTIYYRVNEKVATPSSIIIMTFETLLGFFLHVVIMKDFAPESFQLWLTCIPIVVFFAPFGAFVMTKMPRLRLAQLLYVILVVQFFGALIVIRPNFNQLLICGATLLVGSVLFFYLSRMERKKEILEPEQTPKSVLAQAILEESLN